eukprot:5905162-Pleurochrysis_carterae.AAC.1
MIRRLMAEKAAEAEARGESGTRARVGEGRRLTFDDQGAAAEPAPRRGDEGAGPAPERPHDRNVRSTLAVEFDGLRPGGYEAMPAAEVVRALEAELGGSGRVTAALAEAAG